MTATSTAALPADFTTAKNPIRIGQIGLGGGIAGSHLNEMLANANFRVVAGCDPTLQDPRAKENAQCVTSLGGKIYATHKDLLGDPNVEAVVIAAPHVTHKAITLDAFAAGKHVLCEKPMATHTDDCRAMVEAQRATGLVGAVQMQHVGRSSMLNLRRRLQEGAIGRLCEIFLSSLWWRENPYFERVGWAGKKMINHQWNLDGVMMNQGIHYINQMLIIAAPGNLPAVATARDIKCGLYRFHDTPALEMEDAAFITAVLNTPDSPRVTALVTTCYQPERHAIEIIGEGGRALWNGTGYIFADGKPLEQFNDDNQEFDGSSRVFNSFAAAIRTGVAPMTAFDKIARTTEFVLGCYAAADWHISPAPWNQVGSLPDVLNRTMEGRCLPNELMPRPTWA